MSDLNLIKVSNLCSYDVYKNRKKSEKLLRTLQDNLINGILDKYIKNLYCLNIIVDRLLKENEKVIKNVDWKNINEEELINTLMCYILYDKSSFYKDKNGKLKDFQVDGVSEFKKLREQIISKYNLKDIK